MVMCASLIRSRGMNRCGAFFVYVSVSLSMGGPRTNGGGVPPPKPRSFPPHSASEDGYLPSHLCCRACLVVRRIDPDSHTASTAIMSSGPDHWRLVCLILLWWVCRRYTQHPQSPPGPPEAIVGVVASLLPLLFPGKGKRSGDFGSRGSVCRVSQGEILLCKQRFFVCCVVRVQVLAELMRRVARKPRFTWCV
jgi:hypothetical protein